MTSRPKNKKRRRIVLLAVLVIGIISFFIANSYVKRYGYNGLGDFISNYFSNSSKANNASYETLKITFNKNDFNKLEALRKKHLERGLIENDDDSYVDAELRHKNQKIKAKIRLKGHMTDHLQDKKWSFRVKTKKGDAFMGMKVFSLQHPGTRQYVYEWIYHQMMKDEGIMALNYDFVKVEVNGEDWGIYALEEHFAQELVHHNNRVKGPIVRFNPDLYWVYRINELEKTKIDEPYSKFQSSFVEAYDRGNTFEDSTLVERYAYAVSLIEKVRRNEIKVAKAFDIEKLARFHAIIDLVGGHHSLDWSDVKYYYNIETNLLEPVAYESFSVSNTYQLGGANKFFTSDSSFNTNWHEILFSDPDFFVQYIKALHRISDKKWLDSFVKRNNSALENKLAILYKEFAYRKFKLDQYYTNQKNIKKILDCPRPLIPYVQSVSSNNITLSIGNADVYPYVITNVSFDSITIPVNTNALVHAQRINSPVLYASYSFAVPANHKINSDTKLIVSYHLLGSDKVLTSQVISAPMGVNLPIENAIDISTADFVVATANEIRVKPGKHMVQQTYFVPKNKSLKIDEGTQLDFVKNASIISYAPVHVLGNEENLVTFTSSDNTGGGLAILNAENESIFNFTQFLNLGYNKALPSALRFYQSNASINNCSFSSIPNEAVRFTKGKLNIKNSYFGAVKGKAIATNFAEATIVSTEFNAVNQTAIDANASGLSLNTCRFNAIGKAAVLADQGSNCKAQKLTIINAVIAIEAKDNSKVNVNEIDLNDVQTAFKAHKKGDVFGPSEITVKGLKKVNVKTLTEAEKKSKITIAE